MASVEQVVVTEHVLARGGKRRTSPSRRQPPSAPTSSPQHRGQQRRQRHVNQHNAILGLVGDERDLLAARRMLSVCSTAPMHGAAK